MPTLQPVDQPLAVSPKPSLVNPTSGTFLLAAITAIPELAHSLLALDVPIPTHYRHALAVVSLIAAWVAGILTRRAAGQADAKAGFTAAVVADHIDLGTPTSDQETVETLRSVAGTGSGQ